MTNALTPDLQRRVIVENVRPQVDCGRFPIKRVVGEQVTVTADLLADGHDVLAGALLYRKCGETDWREVRMALVENDRWQATFTVDTLGRYEYTVEAWIDRFESWRTGLSKKFGAGQDVENELLEGAVFLRDLERTATPEGERVALALTEDLRRQMAQKPDRTRATRFDRILGVTVEPERARFSAWYEMFPRSAGTDPARSATFAEAARRLPYVASMGFDVLYLPPIHPIGRSFRKGPNNSLESRPGDPGSPWAIGSSEGGHTAVEPGLGTIDDFDRFVEAAGRHGLEIALDLAYQASPGSSVRSQSPRLVPPAPGWDDQVRGEPAEEVPGHLPAELRVG